MNVADELMGVIQWFQRCLEESRDTYWNYYMEGVIRGLQWNERLEENFANKINYIYFRILLRIITNEKETCFHSCREVCSLFRVRNYSARLLLWTASHISLR